MKGLPVWLAAMVPVFFVMSLTGQTLDQTAYAAMARRITQALRPQSGERVILRFDVETLPALEPVLRKMLEQAGAAVETIPYGAAPDFERRLNRADVYIWLPAGPRAITPADEAELLGAWLDSGRGRQVHFHWGDGTRRADGLNGAHSAAYDRVYLDALDIDYEALDRQMEQAIAQLRSGEVRVTTPAGTDIRFRVGDRPFCKQNGDASKERMATARVRIDREIELPAGALRVAPIESSVSGVMVIPAAPVGEVEARNIRLEFDKGVVKRASAATNEEALRRYLNSGPGLKLFREFAIGFNPKLMTPPGERWVAYYGYGAGVVRLGLGDNSELGGQARGGPVRWLFFPDATVRVGDEVLVDKGRLSIGR
ncbi:MAG TPA: aminopeptidase [Blastocatellia bacterium]|nr:aminopeptidase [Blastocatellia bacterium]